MPSKPNAKRLTDVDFSSLQQELRFDEWWQRQWDPDWVEVAEGSNQETASYWGTSWLIEATQEAVEQAFKKAAFDVDFRDGVPSFGQMGGRSEILYLPYGTFPGYPQPFVVWREFHGLYPPEIAVLQEFVFYHGLYFDVGRQAHIEPVTQGIVVEYKRDPVLVRVRRDHLCDFLAARKQTLVRGFDNRRHLTLPAVSQFERTFTGSRRRFDLSLHPEDVPRTKTNAFVRMIGKYTVAPYAEPKHESYRGLKQRDSPDDPKVPMIVGKDDNGNPIEARSLLDADFLTPIFFRRDLLQRFYNNPRLYKMEATLIRYIDEWSIDYGINDAGFAHVWLGDFWKILPYDEQLLWRSFNVVPSGGLEDTFFKNQIAAEFADTKREDYRLIKVREELNRAWQAQFTFSLFKTIPQHEVYVLSTLHVPTSAELREFSEQISYLAKVMIETLDKTQLEQRVISKEKLLDEKGQKKASIATLEVFLSDRHPSESGKVFCQQLKLLQGVRSKLPAHLTSKEDLASILAKGGFRPETPLPEIFATMLAALRQSMEKLSESLTGKAPIA